MPEIKKDEGGAIFRWAGRGNWGGEALIYRKLTCDRGNVHVVRSGLGERLLCRPLECEDPGRWRRSPTILTFISELWEDLWRQGRPNKCKADGGICLILSWTPPPGPLPQPSPLPRITIPPNRRSLDSRHAFLSTKTYIKSPRRTPSRCKLV